MRENELLSEDLEWSTPSDDAIGEFVVRSYILIDGIVYMRISDYCAKTDAYYCSPALLGDDGNYFVSGPLNTHWRKQKSGQRKITASYSIIALARSCATPTLKSKQRPWPPVGWMEAEA